MKQSCCYKCERRFENCHGKNPDGSWRCEPYRRWREAVDAESHARRAHETAERDVEVSKKAMRKAARHNAADHG